VFDENFQSSDNSCDPLLRFPCLLGSMWTCWIFFCKLSRSVTVERHGKCFFSGKSWKLETKVLKVFEFPLV